MAVMRKATVSRATQTAAWDIHGRPREQTLSIRQLQHSFGEGELRKQVLFDNNLDVHAGEIVIMTGPSGSGKTTLLTLIGTLRTVQDGSLQVLGQELRGAPPPQRIRTRRDLGFIFQAHNLFGSLSAKQNVRMALELFGGPTSVMDERAENLLKRLGLGHRMNYKPDSLSGGQKQRVAIARGIAHRPKIILADEPTAALDEASGREVVTLFQELAREEKVTILMVTHDNRILDVADRIVNMVDGRIRSDVLVAEAAVICDFLQRQAPFSGLTPATLTMVADKMWAEQYLPGEIIIREGDVGDRFYLIRRGEVEVLREGPEGVRVLTTLSEGACFGEQALLTGKPRNATIRTRTPTLVYVLGPEDFQAALAASDTFEEELQKALFDRQ
jgi:putative ABC transport system ATP-binding protein